MKVNIFVRFHFQISKINLKYDADYLKITQKECDKKLTIPKSE